MIRNLVAGLLLALAAAAGVLTVWAMYDLAEIYADPVGGPLTTLGTFGAVVVVGVLVVAVLGGVAAAVVPARRAVALVVAGLTVATLVGVVVAGFLGLDAKREQTAQPSRCGIGNAALAAELRRIDHPGYFGGGSETPSGCSYVLTVTDVESALEAYDDELSAKGYDVVRTDRDLTATRGSFELTARVRHPAQGDPFLQVSLR